MSELLVKYNIEELNKDIKNVELDKESIKNLKQEDTQKLEDLGTSLINAIFAGVEESVTKVFEYADIPKIVQIANVIKLGSITLSIDYAMYLADEREKHGDNGVRDHAVAISQTLVGWGFAGIGAAGGSFTGTFAAPVAGTIAGGVSGAITASIIYDVKNVAGKPMSEWVGDAARILYTKFDSPSKDGDLSKIIINWLKNSQDKLSGYVSSDGYENNVDLASAPPTILPTFWNGGNDNRPTNKRDDNKPSSSGSSSHNNKDGGKGFFPTPPTDKPTSGPDSGGGAGFNFWSTPDRDYRDNPFGYMKDFALKNLFEESSFGQALKKTNSIFEPGWLYSDHFKKDNQEYIQLN